MGPLVSSLQAENVAGLGLVLHRCPGVPQPHVLRCLPTLDATQVHRVLQVFAGALELHPGPVVDLFTSGAEPLRRSMVAFFAGWPSPLAAAILVRSTDDEDSDLRAAGARGIGLLAAEAPAPLIAALDDDVPSVRRAALMSLGALGPDGIEQPGLRDLLVDRIRTGPADERAEAALALYANAAEAPHPDAVEVLEEIGAFEALDSEEESVRRLAARALALRAPHDVRARERTFLIAEGDDPVGRAAACAGLVSCDRRDLPPLIARAVSRSEGDPTEHFYLRLAAQRIGKSILPPLLRLVRTARPGVALLAAELSAATGEQEALEGLLRSLPHRRGDVVGMVIRSHAAAFGDAAVDAAADLLMAEVGIIPTAICEFLLQFGDADRHAGVLIESLTRSEAHRGPALAALECFAATAPQAVLAALDRRRDVPGGDWVRARIGLD